MKIISQSAINFRARLVEIGATGGEAGAVPVRESTRAAVAVGSPNSFPQSRAKREKPKVPCITMDFVTKFVTFLAVQR